MRDEPRHLAPHGLRRWLVAYFNELRKPEPNEVPIHGCPCPFCRQMDNERLPTLRLRRQASLARFSWIECLRLYDLILAHGIGAVYENKEKMTGYKFSTGFASKLIDGMSGLDQPLILCKQDRAGIGTFLPNNENKRLVVTNKFLSIWSSGENDRIDSVLRRLLLVIPVKKPSEDGSHP